MHACNDFCHSSVFRTGPATKMHMGLETSSSEGRKAKKSSENTTVPKYRDFRDLDPVNELTRGRFGSGTLLVFDEAKQDHFVAKRVSKLNRAAWDLEIQTYLRLKGARYFVQFLGTLPSSTHCFQFLMEHVMDGNLFDLVVPNVGLPDPACKHIVMQLRDALDYLHNRLKIIHGDLRPKHVLISSMTHCHIKLCSFSKSHHIGACVKKNARRGCARSPRLSAEEGSRRLRSFLIHRTSSLTCNDLHSVPSHKSKSPSTVYQRPPSSSSRRHSVFPTHNSTDDELQSDVHEYTVLDVKREITSEIFSTAFTAPELINASRYIASPASDNWSLGILAVYMMTGTTPWENASVDNAKYTTFIRSQRRSHSLSPMLSSKCKRPHSLWSAKRSISLSSVFSTFRIWGGRDRLLTLAFEKKIVEILQADPTTRQSLHLPDEWFTCKWGFNTKKWSNYQDRFFDETWMDQS